MNAYLFSASLLVSLILLEWLSLLAILLLQGQTALSSVRILYTIASIVSQILITILSTQQKCQITEALITVYILIKGSVFPFHQWLPQCAGCTTTTSILLHVCTVVYSAVYLHIQFNLDNPYNMLLQACALVTLAYSLYKTTHETNHKKLLVYTTQTQLSYAFILSAYTSSIAIVYTMAIHAVYKSVLFAIHHLEAQGRYNTHTLQLLYLAVMCSSLFTHPYSPVLLAAYICYTTTNILVAIKIMSSTNNASNTQTRYYKTLMILGVTLLAIKLYPLMYAQNPIAAVIWHICALISAYTLQLTVIPQHPSYTTNFTSATNTIISTAQKLVGTSALVLLAHTTYPSALQNINLGLLHKLHLPHNLYFNLIALTALPTCYRLLNSPHKTVSIGCLGIVGAIVTTCLQQQSSNEVSVAHLLSELVTTMLLYSSLKYTHTTLNYKKLSLCTLAATYLCVLHRQNAGLAYQHTLQQVVTQVRGFDTINEVLILFLCALICKQRKNYLQLPTETHQ